MSTSPFKKGQIITYYYKECKVVNGKIVFVPKPGKARFMVSCGNYAMIRSAEVHGAMPFVASMKELEGIRP